MDVFDACCLPLNDFPAVPAYAFPSSYLLDARPAVLKSQKPAAFAVIVCYIWVSSVLPGYWYAHNATLFFMCLL